MSVDSYLIGVLQKYEPRDLQSYAAPLTELQRCIQTWAGGYYVKTLNSGSRAKGTAISIASDVDFLVSLSSGCNEQNGGLKGIFDSLFKKLSTNFANVRKQNVSVRVNLYGLEVDVTPATKQPGFTNDHWVYLSKSGTRQQTNIQKHISDISNSGRTNEIKVIKIWRELNGLDFPSIYLEYLIVKRILTLRAQGALGNNCLHIMKELAKESGNPLFARVIDPANSSNVLSDLLNVTEKSKIIAQARIAASQAYWSKIVW